METQGADEEPSWSNFFGVTSKSKRQPSPERSKSKGAGEFSRNKERNWGDFGEEDSRGGDGRDKRVRRRRRRGRAAALACGWLAIALMSSELVASAKKSPTTILGEDKPTFKAWDCHNPQQIQVLEVPEQCTNEKDDGDTNKQADKTERVTIYQRAKKTFLAFRCRAFKSKIDIYCGMWSHEEIVRPMEVKRPVDLSIEECEQMQATGIWTSPNNRNHHISSPGTTFLNYIEAGRMTYHHHQVSCEGSDVVIDGKIYEGIVSLVDIEIEIKEVEARKTDNGFQVREGNVVTGSRNKEGEKIQGQGTFLWKNWWRKAERCPLVKLTSMEVRVFEEKDGQSVIFSEKNKIYVILLEQVLANDDCDKGVYFKTNLEDIFVRRNMGQADLKKENDDAFLSPEVDVNIANLVNEINDFAVGILRAEMRAVEERVECKRLLQQVHSGSVERLPNREGKLTMVRGEIAVQVQCREATVVHRHLDHSCTELLPVWVEQEENKTQWFLEPISRILRKSSSKLPCSAALQGFQATDGRFYRASPELSVVEKPEGTIFHNNIQVDTASGRGVYSPQQLKRLDSILRWPELKQATQDVKQQYDLSQPVWRPEEAGGVEDSTDEQTWWSWDDLFSMVNRWKYWLAAIALPTALGGVSWLARVAGLASGCRTDARLGGVGLTSTLLSLFCHSYQQGRKQAEERRQAIPEVNLRMQFLQQVKEEEKEMRMKRIQPKEEVDQEENEGEAATLT